MFDFFVSEKAVKQMCEERKQMLQKIIDNDEQWEEAKEEVTQVVAQHSVIQTKLEQQEQLTFMEEQRARVSDNMCTRSPVQENKKNLRCQLLSPVLLCALCMLYRKRLKT